MDKAERFKNAKYIFMVGIGGSDLSAKAVWSAMTEHRPTDKKIFFLESPDAREYEEVQNFIQNEIAAPDEVVLIAASKSGQTAETLAAFHKTFEILSEKFGAPINERVLVISGAGTPLWQLAEQKSLERLEWEKEVGGRFSAFRAPHSVVLSIAGLDVEKFKEGAAAPEALVASESLAPKIFEDYKAGKDILDFFFFNSELETLGKWCRQLIAESLGKKNRRGEQVGLTPTVSLGPTDLHSMLQLSLGGPKTRFTVFVRSLREIKDSVNEKAYEDAVAAYDREGLPNYRYEMPEINEYELGRFMAFMMATTLELAELLEVNPYDQPEVEEYKKNLNI